MSDPTVPYGNHQFEIYLRGLDGERPALPTTYDGLEARARAELSPEAYAYVAGGAGEGRTMRANRAVSRPSAPNDFTTATPSNASWMSGAASPIATTVAPLDASTGRRSRWSR